MRIIITISLLTIFLPSTLKGQGFSAEAWVLADENTIRLAPSDFVSLPLPIIEELEKQNCTIPQVFANEAPGNVVTGHFFSEDQMDIAVLCSRNKTSSILVFRNGDARSVEELVSAPDRRYLQDIGYGQIGFSRDIEVVSPDLIKRQYEAYGEPAPEPRPLRHDGIDDGFVGKASVIWYWYNGQWINLRGSD